MKKKSIIEEDYKKGILKDLREAIRESSNFYSNYPKNICDYIWVGTKDEIIGEWDCHYEFIFHGKEYGSPNYLSLEVHLCESGKGKAFKDLILDNKLKFDEWYDEKNRKHVKKGRIVFKRQSLKHDNKQLVAKAMKKLTELDKLIGEELKLTIIKNDLSPQKLPDYLKSGKITYQRHFHSIIIKEALLEIRHGKLQEKLLKQIKSDYTKVDAEFECEDIKVDVYGLNGNVYDIYEVKSYCSATQCIREALGQILYYKYVLEKDGKIVGKLYIAGSEKLLNSDENYLKSVNEGRQQKVEYIQIL